MLYGKLLSWYSIEAQLLHCRELAKNGLRQNAELVFRRGPTLALP